MKQLVLGCLLCLSIPALYFLAIGRSHVTEVGRIETHIDSLYSERPVLEAQVQLVRGAREEVDRLEELVAEVDPEGRSDGNAPSLLLAASTSIRAFGLGIDDARILPPAPRAEFRSERVNFRLTGSFLDLTRFIRQVEQLPPFHRVTSLRVGSTNQNGTVRAELDLERLSREGS